MHVVVEVSADDNAARVFGDRYQAEQCFRDAVMRLAAWLNDDHAAASLFHNENRTTYAPDNIQGYSVTAYWHCVEEG